MSWNGVGALALSQIPDAHRRQDISAHWALGQRPKKRASGLSSPVGEKSSPRICFTCPWNDCMLLPLRKSQSRTRASSPAVATSEPSGWKAMPYKARVCPSCSKSSEHRSVSHNRHVVSNEVVPTKRPDGWKAMRERRAA
eukprot:scaffold259694_cov30-Tisochrysis_lutea.AAC.3